MTNELLSENNEKEKLTIEELKECEGFEHYSNNESKKMIDLIYDMSVILFNYSQIKP